LHAASLQNTAHLAIETTGRLGSVAVLLGQRVLRQTNLDPTRRTAATLAPAIEQTLQWCRQSGNRPSFVSVADGPGSFTGLRIAVTTAKALSYALDFPLVSVDSLAAIAAVSFHHHPHVESLLVTLDAYRGQVFAGKFERAELLPPFEAIPSGWTAHPPATRVLTKSQWNGLLSDLPPKTKLVGDIKPVGDSSHERIDRPCDAVGVGLLAIRAAAAATFIDPLSLVPRYLRVSAAEEKAQKK
jgi:tRNA threonylcarbamoyladenosine biosynthesis protein TsaB